MKRVISLILCFTSMSTYANWYQPPLYMHPGQSGRFGTTPPPPLSRRSAWDGQIDVRRSAPSSAPRSPGVANPKPTLNTPVGATGTRAKSDSGSGSVHGPGYGIEFDIAGMESLYQQEEARKALKEYMEWLNSVAHRVNEFYKEQAHTAADLRKKGYAATKSKAVMAQDESQIEAFEDSGEELVMLAVMNRARVLGLLGEFNIPVSTGSNREAAIFADVYERFQAQENEYFRQLIQNGRDSTRQMRERAMESVRDAELAASRLNRINSELRDSAEDQHPAPPPMPEDFREQTERVDQKIGRIDSASPQGAEFKALARSALDQSAVSMAAGKVSDARWFLSVAEGVANVALGIDPVTGFYRSLAESVSGYNVVTFEKLTPAERGLAVLGVLSAGSLTSVRQVIHLAGKLGAPTRLALQIINASERGGQVIGRVAQDSVKYLQWVRARFTGAERAGALDDLGKALVKVMDDQGLQVKEILSSEQLNDLAIFKVRVTGERLDAMPPFQGWTHGFKVATRQDEKFIRLSGDGAKPIGRWIVREKDVANILHDPGALQKRLSLPEIPTHISDVRVPKDTEFYAGKVRSNFQGEEGANQFWYPGDPDRHWFSNPRPIKGANP